jgi:hypothetical protein
VTLATSCETCAFWHQHGPHDGTCRRNAPLPTEAADEIAHWPMTDAQERCGEGIMRDQAPVLVSCGECRFWRTNPGGGIDPLNRRDARRDWWKTAGHCVRHSPQPSSDPGCRGFWRATSFEDSCAEGEPILG